jgi:hypothetical protein
VRIDSQLQLMQSAASAGPEAGCPDVFTSLLKWGKRIDTAIFFDRFRASDADELGFYTFMRDLHALHGKDPQLWAAGDQRVRDIVDAYLRRYTNDGVFMQEPFVKCYCEGSNRDAGAWFALLLAHAGMRTGIEFILALLVRRLASDDLAVADVRRYAEDTDLLLTDIRARGVNVLPRVHPRTKTYAPCRYDDDTLPFIWGYGTFTCPGMALSAHKLFPVVSHNLLQFVDARWDKFVEESRNVAARARAHRSYASDPGIAFFGAVFQTNALAYGEPSETAPA